MALAALAIAACATPHLDERFSGGDGSSCAKAIVLNVDTTADAARAQDDWYKIKHGSGVRLGQSLSADGARWYDLVSWSGTAVGKITACFDITRAQPR